MKTFKDIEMGVTTKIELFVAIRRPEDIIKKFMNLEDDAEIQTGLVKLVYKMNKELHKLQVSISPAISNKREGLYFCITFRAMNDDKKELMDFKTIGKCLKKIKKVVEQFLKFQEEKEDE